MKKSFVIGFFIGIGLYLFIFGIRVMKVLIKGRWRFDMIRHGLFNTFNDPGFVLSQFLILLLCVVGSITLYYFYKEGYFKVN
jgi:hypothetical protein